MEVYVARQPIFDRNNEVFAYELLYRNNEKNFFDGSVTSNVATSLLILNSYYTFGIDKLVGEGRAFINFDKHLIDYDIPYLLDKDKVVIELLEDIVPDKFFVDKVRQLKEAGYTIAVDDYVEGYKYQELVKLSDIIKVDFFENTKEAIASIAKEWKKKGKILLAEKVETQEIFDWAKSLGYELFQGYYFSKPSMMKGKKMQESTFQYIQIMNELNRKEPNYKEIASIIETDSTLTYKVLKLVNMNFTRSKSITSIQHAISILGIKSLEKWVSLAMVQDLSSDVPDEIIKLSMTRARFMEMLANNTSLKEESNEMMLVGILSVIDALLDQPMEEVLEYLPLSNDVKSALMYEEGPYTDSYNLILHFEKGEFDLDELFIKKINQDWNHITQYYYEAIEWTEFMYGIMKKF